MTKAVLALLLLLTFPVTDRVRAQTRPPGKPKLVVFLVVDQLRGE